MNGRKLPMRIPHLRQEAGDPRQARGNPVPLKLIEII
jgi:hypothetical protein